MMNKFVFGKVSTKVEKKPHESFCFMAHFVLIKKRADPYRIRPNISADL